MRLKGKSEKKTNTPTTLLFSILLLHKSCLPLYTANVPSAVRVISLCRYIVFTHNCYLECL